jgi:hypothetical protein
MSAITETEPGGEMVSILDFSAQPRDRDNQPIVGERRHFHVGECVRYRGFFFKSTPEDNPSGFMVVFEPIDQNDANRYAAVQSYFVAIDCWEGLRKHFASAPARKRARTERGKTPRGRCTRRRPRWGATCCYGRRSGECGHVAT